MTSRTLPAAVLWAALIVVYRPAGAADSALLHLLPPDAVAIAGVNVAQIKASGFSQSILSNAQLGSPGLKQWAEAGLEPLRDFDEILFGAPPDAQRDRGLILVRGRFNRARCEKLAGGPGLSVQIVHGASIFVNRKQAQPAALACPDDTLLIGGDPASVREAVVRRAKGSPAPALASRALQLSASYHVWLVADTSLADLARQVGNAPAGLGADLFKSVRQASGGIRFGPTLLVSADLETAGEAEAASLAGALRMLGGFAGSARPETPGMAAVLESFQLSVIGSTVRLSLDIPQEAIAQAIGSAVQGVAQEIVQGAGAPGPPPPPAGEIRVYSSPSDMGVVTLPAPGKR